MAASSDNLLHLAAPEAARRLTLGQLEQWEKARARLDDPEDPEALHDFRVALRRLRALLRATRSSFEGFVPRRLRRRLRRLADATSASRDLEVQVAWIRAEIPNLASRQRAGARWLLGRLESRLRAANLRLQRRVEKRFGSLRDALRSTLLGDSLEAADRPAALSAGELMGRAVMEWSAGLERQLAAIHAISDEAEAHVARITVKRLRYVLEPFEKELPVIPSAILRLKTLQDVLGDLHDSHRIASELHQALREAAAGHAERVYVDILPWEETGKEAGAAEGPDARGGLAALARRLRARGDALFAELRSEWLDNGAASRLCGELAALGEQVARPSQPGIEIERKFLLSALPPHVRAFPAEEIEQGWLPGSVLVERLRHVWSNGWNGWYRTVKAGQGLQRVEIEEAITQELFNALWPVTEGCRVRKRRYVVPDSPLMWEIDEFLDRELVLAEIELPAVDSPVELPAWLREHVVREVTAEPDYVNRALAR